MNKLKIVLILIVTSVFLPQYTVKASSINNYYNATNSSYEKVLGISTNNTGYEQYDFDGNGSFDILDIVYVLKALFGERPNTNPTPQPTPTIEPSTTPTPTTPQNGYIPDLYKENVENVPHTQAFSAGVVLNKKALEIAVSKNWDGDPDTLSLRPEDFGNEFLNNVKTKVIEQNEKFEISQDKEQYYKTEASMQEMLQVATEAKQTYIRYLQAKNVNPEIIRILKEEVLPDKPNTILVKDIGKTGSYANTGEYGVNSVQITISIYGAYNNANIVRNSGIANHMYTGQGEDYEKMLRNMGINLSCFHEFTHALQKSYKIYHNENKWIAWLEKDYFRIWGRPWSKDQEDRIWWENEHIGEERQAEGITGVIFSDLYNLSLDQKQVFNNHTLTWYDNLRVDLDSFLTTFETKYPEFNPTNFGDLAATTISKSGGYGEYYEPLKRLRTGNSLPAYWGYFNAYTTKQEVDTFWAQLQ